MSLETPKSRALVFRVFTEMEYQHRPLWKKLKNGCHFININHAEKFQNYHPPKVWISGFLSVDRNGISVLAIMKKLKNGHHFVNINCTEKFQITAPLPKFGFSGFPSVDRNRILASVIMKKMKNGHYFVNINHMEKFQNTNPPPPHPKFRSLVFWVLTEMEYQCWP